MGNWNINIQGVGSHHNTDNPTDANKMAHRFVHDLIAAGHCVQGATFTHGGAEDIRPATASPAAPLVPDERTRA